MLRPRKTTLATAVGATKTLIYAPAGWGKTTQAAHYQRAYGKGLILSAESGLLSLAGEDIDFITITSWDGRHDPEAGRHSFAETCQLIRQPAFQELGYRWIMLDSVTEVADLLMQEIERRFQGSKNGFEKWGEYKSKLLGGLKWLRDMDCHVILTALVREKEDENGARLFTPMLQGQAVAQQLTGIYDYVFAGVSVPQGDPKQAQVQRYLVTTDYRGYKAKARDPRRRLAPVEPCDNVPALLERVAMPDSEYETWLQARKAEAETPAQGST